ncbi:pyridine nucleotide-disulfide oxidoreductase, partial [Myxococcota bacterium]|nr:pyridine nucleotide-disulfide oxidoreductase [Myxococcota bacterium]
NALHVNDLVDYVSESARVAGEHAARFARIPTATPSEPVIIQGPIATLVPQRVSRAWDADLLFFFRGARTLWRPTLRVEAGGRTLLQKTYPVIRPPEMERIALRSPGAIDGPLRFILEEAP